MLHDAASIQPLDSPRRFQWNLSGKIFASTIRYLSTISIKNPENKKTHTHVFTSHMVVIVYSELSTNRGVDHPSVSFVRSGNFGTSGKQPCEIVLHFQRFFC
jgi:hypothetical protein